MRTIVLASTGIPDEIYTGLFVFVMAAFAGLEVIRRVPQLLHTPLMSLTNALSGIALVGSLVLAGADYGKLETTLGAIAITASTINVVGGFWITDRMLKMFKPRPRVEAGEAK
jgi:NAD(P) transhydrogenase subunit alpha